MVRDQNLCSLARNAKFSNMDSACTCELTDVFPGTEDVEGAPLDVVKHVSSFSGCAGSSQQAQMVREQNLCIFPGAEDVEGAPLDVMKHVSTL